MALNAKKQQTGGGNKGPEQEPLEAGNYPARLVQIISLGLQAQRPYQGQEKPPVEMIRFTYELVDEFMKDENGEEILDKPRWISEDMPFHNLDADLSKSTKRYKVLDPEIEHGGDWTALIGAPLTVTVVQNPGKGKHAGKVFVNVGGTAAMRARDAQKCPELVNDPKIFDLDEPDMEVFGAFPEWLQDKIKDNLEFEGSPLQAALGGEAAAPAAQAEPAPQAEDEEDDEDRPF